jgi:hypothetical protein
VTILFKESLAPFYCYDRNRVAFADTLATNERMRESAKYWAKINLQPGDNMKRKLALPALAIFLLALPLAAQTDAWAKYDNKEGNFTVLFPQQPADSVNGTDPSVQSHTLMARHESAIYTVIYTVHNNSQTVDNATYQVFRDAVFKELPKCSVEVEQGPAPALDDYIGHWYHLTCDMPKTKVLIDGNLYWGKRYAYAVMVMYPASVVQPQAEKKFWDSFSVLAAAN